MSNRKERFRKASAIAAGRDVRSKLDRIWDLVLNLDESEDVTGRISYAKDCEGEGRMSVTLDGKRYSVYIEGPEDE